MKVQTGLGIIPGERSFFHENEQNDQEQYYYSEKRTERNRMTLLLLRPEWNKNETIEKKERERNKNGTTG